MLRWIQLSTGGRICSISSFRGVHRVLFALVDLDEDMGTEFNLVPEIPDPLPFWWDSWRDGCCWRVLDSRWPRKPQASLGWKLQHMVALWRLATILTEASRGFVSPNLFFLKDIDYTLITNWLSYCEFYRYMSERLSSFYPKIQRE